MNIFLPSNKSHLISLVNTFRPLGISGVSNAGLAQNQVVWRVAGTFSKLRVIITANDGALTFAFQVNGSDGNQVISVGSGLTGVFEDLTHSDTTIVTDQVAYRMVRSGGTTDATVATIGNLFVPSGDLTYMALNGTSGINGNANPIYFPPAALLTDATEANAQRISVGSSSLKNLKVIVTTNTKSGATTIRSRIDGNDGNLIVSVNASTSGTFEDSVNSDSIVEGSLVNFGIFPSSTGFMVAIIHSALESAANSFQYFSDSNIALALGGAASRYSGFPAASTAYTTVTDISFPFASDVIASLLKLKVTVNSTSVATTCKLNIDGSDGDLSVSIAAATTGLFEDTSHQDFISTDDLLALHWNFGSGGNFTVRGISILMTEGVPPPPSSGNRGSRVRYGYRKHWSVR